MSTFIPKKVTPRCKRTIDKQLLHLFTDTFQPFRIVEEKAFRSFVAALNPSYELPTRHTISRTLIPAMYEQCIHETHNVLKNVRKVCVTTDCWTSINNESYMGVTVHFLDETFNPVSLLLECSTLPVAHTSINLAKELKRILTEWNLEKKHLMIVSDNAANIRAAIQNELQWKHFGCFAHTINLVVHDGLKEEEISRIIIKVKNIVSHFKRSPLSTEKLLAYQRNQGNGNQLKLLQDVATRWNSVFYMLERFLTLEEAVKATMALINIDISNNLTVDEWNVIRELCQVLKSFESVTKQISGENYLTASVVIPIVNGLNSVYKSFETTMFTQCIKTIIKQFQVSLKERFVRLENSNTLSMCTFLDPRFKNIAFLDANNAEMAKKILFL